MVNKIKQNKLTFGLVLSLIFLAVIGFISYQKFVLSQNNKELPETELIFDAEGPYAVLTPRRDGNALILNLKRTASHDEISYELAYISSSADPESLDGDSSAGIERGVVGTIDTKDKKGEYQQEILFGTCSRNVCKYDEGVENGTLTLHIKRGKERYRMVTTWHLQESDLALGKLISGDGHFRLDMGGSRQELVNLGFVIIHELTGVPKLPEGKQVLGKVYAANFSSIGNKISADLNLELAEPPPQDAKLFRFDEGENSWKELETKVDGNKLSSKTDGAGIFAVLTFKE